MINQIIRCLIGKKGSIRLVDLGLLVKFLHESFVIVRRVVLNDVGGIFRVDLLDQLLETLVS